MRKGRPEASTTPAPTAFKELLEVDLGGVIHILVLLVS